MKLLTSIILACSLWILASGNVAIAQVEQQQTVNSSLALIERLRTNEGFAQNMINRLHNARAILIFPALYKGGFLFGGEYGNGVLLGHLSDGSWSYPAFYQLGGVSFGLQIGLESSSILLLIMNEKALNAVLSSKFKLGADTEVTFITIGVGASAATTGNLGADIIAISMGGLGLYGGLSLEGTILSSRDEWDSIYYNSTISSREIIAGNSVQNREADRLREYLGR